MRRISFSHRKIHSSVRPVPFSGVIAACLLSPHLPAADFIWDGGAPGTNSWGAINNWNPDASVPNNGSADLIFSGGTRPMPNAQSEYSINTLRFSGTATAFTVTGDKITFVQNAGQAPFIRNETGSTHAIENAIAFGNPGTVQVQSGGLWLKGPLDNGGHALSLTAAAGRTLTLGVAGQPVAFFGAGNVTVNGPGTVRFNSINLASGSFTVASGTAEILGTMAGQSSISVSGIMRLMGDDRIPTVPFSLPSGTLSLDGHTDTIGALSGLAAGRINLGNGGSLTVQQTTNTSYSGIIEGTGSFTKSGTGTLTLSGPVGHTGATTVAGGTLHIGTGSSLSANAGLVVNSGATLSMAGITRTVPSVSGSGTIALGHLTAGGNNADSVFSGTFTGAGSFTKAGGGVMEITTPQNHTAGTHVSAGVLFARANQALGAGGATTVSPGATLRLEQGISVNRPGTTTISGTGAAGSGAIQAVSTGTLAIATHLTGPLRLADHASIVNGTNGVLNLGASNGNETLDLAKYDLTASVTAGQGLRIRHRLGGDGAIIKTGQGPLRLAADNSTHTGPIDIQSGNLELEHSQALSGGSSPVTLATGRDVIQRNGISTVTARQLLLGDTCELVTHGASSWSGTGHIQLNGVSSGGILANDSADFTLNGPGIVTGSAYLRVTANDGATIRINRQLAMNARLSKIGPGTLILGGSNSYGGTTTIHAGTLRLAAADRLPDGTQVSISSGATFDLAGFSERVASLEGVGGIVSLGTGRLTLSPTADKSFSGNIAGTAAGEVIVNGGSGIQTFASANDYTGPTTVRLNGKLSLTAAGALSPTARLTVESGGEVRIGAAGQAVGSLAGNGVILHTSADGVLRVGGDATPSTWGGSIQGPGGLVKTGSSTLTMTSGQSHTGPTTVEAGRLNVRGLSSSAATIAAGAELHGSGAFSTIDSSGRLGNLDNGDTIFANAVTLREGSRLAMTFNHWGAPAAIQAASLERIGGHISLSSSVPPDFSPGETRVLKVLTTTGGITGNTSGIFVYLHDALATFNGTALARVQDGDLEVVFTAPLGDGYEAWIAGYDHGGKDGFDEDSDGDGLPNGIEYILGGSPETEDSALLPTLAVDATHIEFVFTRMKRATYLPPVVEHSTTLQAPWTAAIHGQNGVTISESEIDAQRDRIIVRIPKGSAPKRFVRLAAELP